MRESKHFLRADDLPEGRFRIRAVVRPVGVAKSLSARRIGHIFGLRVLPVHSHRCPFPPANNISVEKFGEKCSLLRLFPRRNCVFSTIYV